MAAHEAARAQKQGRIGSRVGYCHWVLSLDCHSVLLVPKLTVIWRVLLMVRRPSPSCTYAAAHVGLQMV